MNKQAAQQYLPLIKALAEGKPLQYKSTLDNKWHDATDLSFALTPDRYRIKPEPIKQEFYYIVNKNSTPPIGSFLYAYKDLSEAQEYLKKIDSNREKYVIMHANATSVEGI